MQAIVTKYIGPTNTKGSRIKATCAAGSITVGYHNVDVDVDVAPYEAERHQLVAAMLQRKLGWDSEYYGRLESGQLPNGDYAHVFVKI